MSTITAFPSAPHTISQKEAVDIAVDAYVYGYPLVLADLTRKQITNVSRADATHAPMGQFLRMRTYPPVDYRAVAGPNADTLYTSVWLDVSKEPWIFSIPDMGDRFYVMPLHDAWLNNFKVVGSRSTGQKAQAYAITGPNWKGTLPPEVARIEAPTGLVWILGRIYSSGTAEDYDRVHALQDQVSVVPLSSYGKPYTPTAGPVETAFDMVTPPRDLIVAMSVNEFFTYFATLMKTNPPLLPQDAAILARIAPIGLFPGQDFDASWLAAFDRSAIEAVPKAARQKMAALQNELKPVNGWRYSVTGVGNFGANYLFRMLYNWMGAGWNVPQDAVYLIGLTDADGNEYDAAANRYILHFERGMLPPVKAFWSLTMYDDQWFFVPNDINRYAISQRNELMANADGSVDLYIQTHSPGGQRESNWLPAPNGRFVLFFRLYWPNETQPSILDGSWKPPTVKIAP